MSRYDYPGLARRKWCGYCQQCGKWSYLSRKAARGAAQRLHPEDSGLHAYQCPAAPVYWHYGHGDRLIYRESSTT